MTGGDPFRTRDHVADFDDYVVRYAQSSSRTRSALENRRDITYGEDEGAALDLFFPPGGTGPAPIHLFIHGGYWRMFDKSDFSFVADTVCAAGGIAAIMNYRLMPAVRMETLVGQVRQCANWLVEHAATFGGDREKFTVSGHSAGGHLSCFLAVAGSPVFPRAILALSGIYDLAPIRQSFLQPELEFTEAEIRQFSPVSLDFGAQVPMTLMAGEAETPPFHDQAAQLHRVLRDRDCPATLQTVPGANHMSIVAQLGDPGTVPGRALASMVASA